MVLLILKLDQLDQDIENALTLGGLPSSSPLTHPRRPIPVSLFVYSSFIPLVYSLVPFFHAVSCPVLSFLTFLPLCCLHLQHAHKKESGYTFPPVPQLLAPHLFFPLAPLYTSLWQKAEQSYQVQKRSGAFPSVSVLKDSPTMLWWNFDWSWKAKALKGSVPHDLIS